MGNTRYTDDGKASVSGQGRLGDQQGSNGKFIWKERLGQIMENFDVTCWQW